MEDRTTLRTGFRNGTVEMSEGWDMAATSVAEETLPWQPGLAMVHFRVAGSEVSDRVAAILAQIVEAHAGRLPLTEVDVDDRPRSPPGTTSGRRRLFSCSGTVALWIA